MSAPHRLQELIPAAEVQERLETLAAQLARDYAETEPLFVVIAEGARRFASRLIEELEAYTIKPEVLIVRARRTSGAQLLEVELEPIPAGIFGGCDVLILDDIADEGRTIEAVQKRVHADAPKSQRIAVLVSKLERRRVPLRLDYVGFEVHEGWVVGFGMDLDGRYRELDALFTVVSDAGGD